MLRTIQEQWEHFASSVYADMQPSKTQYEETRKAFYAGFWSMLCDMETLTNPTISESTAVTHITNCRAECTDFFRENLRNYLRKISEAN